MTTALKEQPESTLRFDEESITNAMAQISAVHRRVFGTLEGRIEQAIRNEYGPPNREQAIAAVNAAFDELLGFEKVTVDSYITEIGLNARIVNQLELMGIYTVRALTETTEAHLKLHKQIGPKAMGDIKRCLARYGVRLWVEGSG